MSSVHSYIKQQNIIYGSVPGPAGFINLNQFTAASATQPTVGSFSVVALPAYTDASAGISPIFRDMGEVIVSAGRTFRRVQMLSNLPVTYGVDGEPSATLAQTDYRTYWAEMSMINGQGIMNGLFQIRG
jgi:hypothetical protein